MYCPVTGFAFRHPVKYNNEVYELYVLKRWMAVAGVVPSSEIVYCTELRHQIDRMERNGFFPHEERCCNYTLNTDPPFNAWYYNNLSMCDRVDYLKKVDTTSPWLPYIQRPEELVAEDCLS